MSKSRIYLAGPVRERFEGGRLWREEMIEDWSHRFEFCNPLDKYNVSTENLIVVPGVSDYRESDTVGVSEIVEGDKEMMTTSDAILVGYTAVESIGTPMEVMWAAERDYPVVVWIQDSEIGLEDMSPWYRYHADHIETSRDDALAKLELELEE